MRRKTRHVDRKCSRNSKPLLLPRWAEHRNRRLHQELLLTAESRTEAQFAHTIADWKNVTWTNGSQCQLHHSHDMCSNVKIWLYPHQAAAGAVTLVKHTQCEISEITLDLHISHCVTSTSARSDSTETSVQEHTPLLLDADKSEMGKRERGENWSTHG